MNNTLCPHCSQPVPPESAEKPRTIGWPKWTKVFIRDKEKPVREVAVVQVLDFYPEAKC